MLVPFYGIRGKVKGPEAIVEWYGEEMGKLRAVSPTGKGLRCTMAELDEAGGGGGCTRSWRG